MSELRERVARAICPKVKPWMDDPDVPPHPCRGCKIEQTERGQSIPMCLAVMNTVTAAALHEVAAWLEDKGLYGYAAECREGAPTTPPAS